MMNGHEDLMIDSFKKYVESYEVENCCGEDCFIKDMLYGIGVAVDPVGYKFAGGFAKFLDRIKEIER